MPCTSLPKETQEIIKQTSRLIRPCLAKSDTFDFRSGSTRGRLRSSTGCETDFNMCARVKARKLQVPRTPKAPPGRVCRFFSESRRRIEHLHRSQGGVSQYVSPEPLQHLRFQPLSPQLQALEQPWLSGLDVSAELGPSSFEFRLRNFQLESLKQR